MSPVVVLGRGVADNTQRLPGCCVQERGLPCAALGAGTGHKRAHSLCKASCPLQVQGSVMSKRSHNDMVVALEQPGSACTGNKSACGDTADYTVPCSACAAAVVGFKRNIQKGECPW